MDSTSDYKLPRDYSYLPSPQLSSVMRPNTTWQDKKSSFLVVLSGIIYIYSKDG